VKLNIPENKITSHGVMSTNTFSITASAKAFKILSSSLYKDKILAIVRELSCNAYDSHVDNGNVGQPFNIQLPSILNPYFKIRDFGTGINHEDMMTLYTTYFSSTKTESNDFIGALGLGSKSPFSYTDAFNVSSFYNGVVKNYTAYIDDAGTPNIALMGEAVTKEPNGVEVSLSVAEGDHRSFKDKISKVFKYFAVKPIIHNYTFPEYSPPKMLFSGEQWKMFKNGYNSPMMAIQGNIGYELAADAIINLPPHLREVIKYGSTDIHFNIGDLDVSASREELSYDERTSNIIIAVLNEIYQTVRNEIIKRIENSKTFWEAQVTLGCILNDYPATITRTINTLNLQFDGKPIEYLNGVDFDKLPVMGKGDTLIRKYQLNQYGKFSSKAANFSTVPYNESVMFIVNDVKNRHVKRLRQHIEKNKINDMVYLIKIGDWVFDKDASLKEFIDALGNPEYSLLSDTEELPKAAKRARAVARKNGDVLKFINTSRYGTEYKWTTHNWDYETLEDPKEIIYVPAYRFDMVHDHIENPQHLKKLINLLVKLDVIDADTPIYGIRPATFKKFNKDNSSTFINLFDLVDDYIKTIDVARIIRYNKLIMDTNSYSWLHMERIKRNMEESHHAIQDYISDVKFYKKESDCDKAKCHRTLLGMLSIINIKSISVKQSIDIPSYVNDNKEEVKKTPSIDVLHKHFPLLKVFDHLSITQHLHVSFNDVVLYMNSKIGEKQ